jgi:hypothetical protein
MADGIRPKSTMQVGESGCSVCRLNGLSDKKCLACCGNIMYPDHSDIFVGAQGCHHSSSKVPATLIREAGDISQKAFAAMPEQDRKVKRVEPLQVFQYRKVVLLGLAKTNSRVNNQAVPVDSFSGDPVDTF